ncbi:MAG: hypothetical protein KIT14_14290 [bacterium]|nr:hypothetical protein [bacterium]
MRTKRKISSSGLLLILLGFAAALTPITAFALHEESPPVTRLSSADDHFHPPGRSWGNWFAFSSTQDLLNIGPARAPGRQIYLFSMGFFDCYQGTTKSCSDPNAPDDCQQTPCPPAGTPYLYQVTNFPGDFDNPSVSVAPASTDPQRRYYDHWIAFDGPGNYLVAPGTSPHPSHSRRQVFMWNQHTREYRQVTTGTDGDSVKPSLSRGGQMMVFESTASLGGFPNPAGVKQVYLYQRSQSGLGGIGSLKRLSVGPAPANVIGLGASTAPILNENGTGAAFQSTADLMGSGNDTGVSQIFYVDIDKRNFVTKLTQVTSGNGPSRSPHLGFTRTPNPLPGADNRRKILLFESSATNLPGQVAGTTGNNIYEVQIAGLPDDNGDPASTVTAITTQLLGDCHYPSVDPSGNRLGFVCKGDPFQNGTTGNRAFALTRNNGQLFQLTGAGDIHGPIGQNIGQWFMTVSTTSDLTQGGSCGYQLYVLDFTRSRWAAATSLNQAPPDVVGQNPTSVIGLKNFEFAPGTGVGGTQIAITTRDGTFTGNLASIPNTAEEGRLGLNIGAPDEFFREASVSVAMNRVKLPAVPIPGYGAVCLEATSAPMGLLDCDGGALNGDLLSRQDHLTDDVDFFCENGCRENDVSCQPLGLSGPYLAQCPTCNTTTRTCDGGPNHGIGCSSDATCQLGVPCAQCPVCDTVTQVCTGGPAVGFPCSSDATCRVGLTCNVVPACNGPLTVQSQGLYQPGGMRLIAPAKLSMSLAPGKDDKWCTADDLKSSVQDVPTEIRLTTGTATAEIQDADAQPGLTIPVSVTGAPFDCTRLRAGDLAGARLVGTVSLLNLRTNPGIRDAILSLRLEPKTNTASSCAAFCQTSADCDDGNLCNGTESCVANRCQSGQPLICNDDNVCNGAETCHPVLGCQTGTPLSCDDGNACNGTETCHPVNGCQTGTPVTCTDPDGDPCTGEPVCNPANGACVMQPPPTCNDANVCTDDSCVQFVGCQHVPNSNPCNDGSACTENDTCSGGVCAGQLTAAAVICNAGDGNVCNGAEACNPANGACAPGTPLVVDDGNPCTDDMCDPITGVSHMPNTAGCNDGNACTSGDVCSGGTCAGTPITCDDGNVCNGVETCDPSSGCTDPPDLVCDDGNTCTSDSCHPINGCQNVPVTNGTGCTDNSLCTTGDSCQNGVCTGTPIVCDDGNVCNGTESCDPGSGCLFGVPLDCDDNNFCTNDSCNPGSGCVNAPNSNPCNDGSLCTTGDVCSGGTCAGTPVSCSDNNACNGEETCNPGTGACEPGLPPSCDDANVCNGAETCNPATGCVAGAPLNCNDGNACNGLETCDPSGGCLPGTPPNCNDDDVCTADSCDPVLGCANVRDPNYALCRMNVLADTLLATPGESLGGVRKKRKLIRIVTGSIKLLQKSLAANPRQAAVNLRRSQRKLLKYTKQLQKYVDNRIVSGAVGDPLLELGRVAALALQELGQ